MTVLVRMKTKRAFIVLMRIPVCAVQSSDRKLVVSIGSNKLINPLKRNKSKEKSYFKWIIFYFYIIYVQR